MACRDAAGKGADGKDPRCSVPREPSYKLAIAP